MLQQEVSRQWAWKGRLRGLACAVRQLGAAVGSAQGRAPWRCRSLCETDSLEEEAAGDGAEEGAAGVVGTKCRRLLAGANSVGGLI